MNKIFKVIWNKTRNCYIVVSELTKRNGKEKSTHLAHAARLAVLAICTGALSLGTVGIQAAVPSADTTKQEQYVAFRVVNSGIENNTSTSYRDLGDGNTYNRFNGARYKETNVDGAWYWVRDDYSMRKVDSTTYTPLSAGNRYDLTYTGEGQQPADILSSTTSISSATGVSTNIGESLNQVTPSVFEGLSQSGGTRVPGEWNYIIYDDSWKDLAKLNTSDKTYYQNGFADMYTGKEYPHGFVVASTDTAKTNLKWDRTLNQYTYKGTPVDTSHLYVINGKIGVFTNYGRTSVYKGTVYGANNEILMTVKKDGKYYSYWAAEVNDPNATMETYRVSDYNNNLQTLKNNDIALENNDIKSVDMTAAGGSNTQESPTATITAMRNGKFGDGKRQAVPVDGAITVKGGGGTNGADTYITLSNTTDGNTVSQTFPTGSKVVATTDNGSLQSLSINRTEYKTTLKFGGDNYVPATETATEQNVITKNLNERLDILGSADKNNLTTNNIGVNDENGVLKIQLAKDLSSITSISNQKTENDETTGARITLGDDGNVSVNGGQITNVASGASAITINDDNTKTYTYDEETNAANIGDVKRLAAEADTNTHNKLTDVRYTNSTADSDTAKLSLTDADGNTKEVELKNTYTTVSKDADKKTVTFNRNDGKSQTVSLSDLGGVSHDYQLVGNNGNAGNGDSNKYTVSGNKVTLNVKDQVSGDTQNVVIDGIASASDLDSLTDRAVKYDLNTDGSVNKNKVTLEGTAGTQIANLASGSKGTLYATTVKGQENWNNAANIGDVKSQAAEVMTKGLGFTGNDGIAVHRDLGTVLKLTGGLTDLTNAFTKNLGVRKNATNDGLEIVMTDTPDFTKVTVGGNNKITIGNQTVTGKTSNGSNGTKETGNYITGLNNTTWNKDNVVADRAATEGQLSQAISDIKGGDNGGFGLADETGKTVKKDLGQTVTVKGDGKNIETNVDGDALEVSLKKDVDLTQDGSIEAGNTTINKDGITTNKVTAGNTTIDTDGVTTNKVKVGDITITKDEINGGATQIINIASGIDGKQYTNAGDNNAASIGDIRKITSETTDAAKLIGDRNITVTYNDSTADGKNTVKLNDSITLGNDADKKVIINGKAGIITAGNKVSLDGNTGIGNIGGVTIGNQNATTQKDGDSYKTENGTFVTGLTNKTWNPDANGIVSGRAATEDQLKMVSDKVNSGRVFQGDDGQSVTVGMGETLNLKGGAKEVSSADNIGIVKGNDNILNIRLAKDIKGINSIEANTITTGNTTIDNSGLTVKTGDSNHQNITIQQGNVNMGGNQIHNVAPGKVVQNSTDAVNGGQLWQRDQVINGLGGAVNKLGSRINRVGAGAAALAALHPLDFDPDDKWDFAAGYGNYRGANAAAVGAYYRPNEDTMFSIGGSFGGGENMVNAGVSFKLGQGNHVSTSRVAMAKEIKELRQNVASLNAIVNRQSALIDKLTGTNAGTVSDTGNDLFPDVPANHWAYEYVTKLKQAGILTGYPDGNFDGDRMMTRYEFAAIVYRAIMAGAASNPALNQDGTLDKLAKEFSPEMKYIRIDTIAKDKNDKPTIERVRVVPDVQ